MNPTSAQQRKRNLRTAIFLAGLALVFFVGFIYRTSMLHT